MDLINEVKAPSRKRPRYNNRQQILCWNMDQISMSLARHTLLNKLTTNMVRSGLVVSHSQELLG